MGMSEGKECKDRVQNIKRSSLKDSVEERKGGERKRETTDRR